MKKILAIICCACILTISFAFTACEKKTGNSSDDSSNAKSSKTDSSKVETSEAESSKAESSKVESSKVESSKADSSQAKPTGSLGSKWDSNQFMIDGKVYELPCKISDLKAAGYKLSKAEDFIVNAKQEVYGTSLNRPNYKNTLTGTYFNPTDKACELKDCYLKDLSVSGHTNAEGFNIVFPGNLTLQSTKEDIIKAYGKPTQIKDEFNEESSLIFIIYQNSYKDKLEIQISRKTGKITSYYRTLD